MIRLRMETAALNGEVDMASAKAANGTVLKGWDGGSEFPDRKEDETYHFENGETLLSIPWFWIGLKQVASSRARTEEAIKALAEKKSSDSSTGNSDGENTPKASVTGKNKQRRSTKKSAS